MKKAAAARPYAVIAMMAVILVLSIAFSRKPPTDIAVADVTTLPTQAGEWQLLGEIPLDEETMKQIQSDSHVHRRYVNPQGQPVDVLVVYRRYGRREFAHRPELCFPAAGYQILSKSQTTLPYAGRDVAAVHLIADGSKVLRNDGGTGVPNNTVTYFFASGGRTEHNFIRQQIWMAFERVIPNKNGWTFVRLTSDHVNGSDDATMLAAQQDFMRAFGPELQRVITTDNATAQVASAPTAP
jgi:EpsI family protein